MYTMLCCIQRSFGDLILYLDLSLDGIAAPFTSGGPVLTASACGAMTATKETKQNTRKWNNEQMLLLSLRDTSLNWRSAGLIWG